MQHFYLRLLTVLVLNINACAQPRDFNSKVIVECPSLKSDPAKVEVEIESEDKTSIWDLLLTTVSILPLI